MAEGIIGSVGVAVVPDAEGFVARFNAQTRGMDEAGRKAGHEWQRGFDSATHGVNLRVNADTAAARTQLDSIRRSADELGRKNPNIRVKADTATATGQMHALRDAILLIGPAAVPLGAVAVGALAGIVPAAGAAILGVKGLINEMKSGQLAGTAFAGDIKTLQGEFATLQGTAAAGLMPGISQAIQATQPAFATVNRDIGDMSAQIGAIVGGLGPALVAIFNALNPLFTTFGQILGDGAKKLEAWATKGTGIQSFVAYVQTELPQVEHDIGQLIVAFVHLAESLAPMGHLALTVIGGIADALDSIPTGVLTFLTSGALAAYAAFRTFGAVTSIVNRVSGAFEAFQAKSVAANARAEASSLSLTAATLEEAATVARAKATEARAVADTAESMVASSAETASLFAGEAAAAEGAAARITASFAGINSMFATNEETAAGSALGVASALETEATAAEVAAATIAEASVTANTALAEAGTAGTLGFAGMLGPLAAVGIGLALVVGLFHRNNQAAQDAQKVMDGYANTLKQNANALAAVNTNQTIKNLQDDKSLTLLNQLHSANVLVGTSQADLVLSVNGSAKAYDNLQAKLKAVEAANTAASGGVRNYHQQLNATGQAASALSANIDLLRSSFTKEQRQQLLAQSIERQAQQLADHGATAVARQAAALGTTSTAYLDAQVAAKKNTDQTRQQTLAFQLESDAASLLQHALDGLAGINLSVAQAQTSLASANLSVVSAFKQNGAAIRGNTQAAVNNQQAIQQQVGAAQQYAEAIGKQTHSSKDAVAAFRNSKNALEDQLRAQGKLTPAVQKYIEKLYNIKNLHVPPTKLDANTAAGDRKIAAYQTEINAIKQGKVPGLTADTAHGQEVLRQLQADIDAIRQHKKPPFDLNMTPAYEAAQRLQRYISNLQLQAHVHLVVPAGTAPRDYIPGQGPTVTNGSAAGSKSWTRDGKLPTGYSTVGERGWELVKTDTAGRSEVFSHAQSRAMTGGPSVLPGFASGTGGLSGNAKKIAEELRAMFGFTNNQIAGFLGNFKVESNFNPRAYNPNENAHGIAQWEGSRWVALQKFARAHHESATSLGTQLGFLGKELPRSLVNQIRGMNSPARVAALIDQQYERSSGKTRAQRESYARQYAGQLPDTKLTASAAAGVKKIKTATNDARAGINALGRDLKGTSANAVTAYNKVADALGKMGAGSGIRKTLREMDNALNREINQRNKTNAALASYISKEKDLKAQVQSSFAGGFDITSAGTGPSGSGGVSYSSIFAQAEQQKNRSTQLAAGIRRLAKLGLNKAEQLQLANAGVSALPQVQALAHASKSQIAALNSDYASINTTGKQLGGTLGNELYGKDIKILQRRRVAQNQEILHEFQRLSKDVKDVVALLHHQKTTITLDGRAIARANRAGQRRANR